MAPLDRLHLGSVAPDAADLPGPVTRAAALVPGLGTVLVADLPVLDDDLCDDVIAAFDAGSASEGTVCTRAELAEFVWQRRGRRIASHESDTAFSPHRL